MLKLRNSSKEGFKLRALLIESPAFYHRASISEQFAALSTCNTDRYFITELALVNSLQH